MPIKKGTPRGVLAAYSIQVVQESAGVTTTIDTNSTALTIDRGIQLNGKATSRITGLTTGIRVAGKIYLSGKTTGTIAHNSTGRLVTTHGVVIGTNGQIYENSTGVYLKWKSTAKYITRNTTAN